MATTRDYYEILGLPRGASIDEVKRAYRRLAKIHHPDMADKSHKKEAEARFKEINEAYQILSDPEKKKLYDQFGKAAFAQEAPFGTGAWTGRWGPFTYTYTTGPAASSIFEDLDFADPFDIFESVFGFRGFGRRERKGRNLYYTLTIEFMDAVRGLEQEIKIDGKKIKVKIPPGTRSGTELRFAGEGEGGPEGAPPGDLYLELRVRSHPRFTRVGDDIYVVKEISFVQAALGGTVEIPTLDPEKPSGESSIKLKVPPGTQPGTDFRLRGKGVPHLRRPGRGDEYVRILVKIPKKLSPKERELLEQLR